MTVPGRPHPGSRVHCNTLGKKGPLDGRCPSGDIWKPQKCWNGLCSPCRLVPTGASQGMANSLLLTLMKQPWGPPHH